MATPSGIILYDRLVQKALELEAKDIWFAFCLETTAWYDDASPTAVVSTDNTTPEAYLFVQATYKALCKSITEEAYDLLPDEDRLLHGGAWYAYVADEDAYDELARFLYVKTTIDCTDEHPAGVFRQVKIFTGLTPTTGHESDTWLLPEDVDDNGRGAWGRNYPVRTLTTSDTWNQAVMIEER
jgi:hypothetical protein